MTGADRSGASLFEAQIFADSRATFESLANSLPISLLIKDAEGRRLFANRAYLKLRGMSRDELVGKRDEDLFPPAIAKIYREDDRQVLERGKSLHDVERTRDTAGRTRWIERVKSPIIDPRGQIIGLQLLFWDVTERVRAEKMLDRERHFLNMLLENIPDSIYFKDTDSRFLRVSRAMAKKFGFGDEGQVVGRTDADIFTREHAHAARADELKIIRTGEPLVDRLERETWPDRDDTWCISTKMPLRDKKGKIVGTFGITRDVSELKASQDALRTALDAAAEANRAKSDFLANMSHEIRTPMNAVIGMTELLRQTELTREQREYVDLVSQSAESLLGLLNDILDFSKIEARKLELERIPFSLRDTVGKSGQTLTLRAAEKGLEIACRIAPDIPDRLIGDPGRIRQILINLISNAIKFTERGEVAVDVSVAEQDMGDQLWLDFSVRDTGIGIPAEKQAAVLEAFTQVDASTTRRYGGTGLGLTISKQLVELMGGSLRLESEPGTGTTFSFTIRLDPASEQGTDPARELQAFHELPVLVVDDNETNRRILWEILSSWHFRPAVVADGPQAIREIRLAAERGTPYRLILLDCMMPGMDGFDVASAIHDTCEAADARMIMLSSGGRGGDVARCQELGIARYMTKPVVQSELLEAVLGVMELGRGAGGETAQATLSHCPPMKVLVAEDGLTNQQVALGLLKAAGHHPVLAGDGEEAVRRWGEEPFDLILMDMHMPNMDGLEATAEIRRREADSGAHVPIIALTAAAMPEDAQACREAGMDDYLAKPIHPEPLQRMMAKYAPERSVDPGADPPAVPTGGVVFDAARAAERIAGGDAGVRRLASVFIPECDTLVAAIETHLAGGNAEEVRRAAHTLKGSARLFAAERVVAVADRIEKLSKAGRLDEAAGMVGAIRDAAGQLCDELRKRTDA